MLEDPVARHHGPLGNEGRHEDGRHAYAQPIDRCKFLRGGKEVLDATAVFWDGLEADRVNRVYL